MGGKGKPKDTIVRFATSVVEDVAVQQRLHQQARDGLLPVPVLQMLFYYAYGRPREQQPDDQAFVADLLGVVLKHAGTYEARQEIRAVIEAHAGGHSIRAVA